MRNTKEFNWLKRQLPEWVEKQMISADQAAAIEAHYGDPQKGPNYNLALLVGGILGALLIGGGIILIFAYNWEQLSRVQRTILSLLPLILAQGIYAYVFFKKAGHKAWVEGSSLFLMLMLAAAIALISQTYHIGGSTKDFLFIWVLLSIPLLYLLNSSISAMFYLVLICIWTVIETQSITVVYWGFFAAAVPHLIYNKRKSGNSLRNKFLAWAAAISFSIGFASTAEWTIPEYSVVGNALLCTIYYFLPYPKTPQSTSWPPFRTLALLCFFFLNLTLTFNLEPPSTDFNEWVNGQRLVPWAAQVNFAIFILLILTAAWLVYRYATKSLIDILFCIIPVIAWIWLFLSRSQMPSIGIIGANIYLLVYIIWLIRKGVLKPSLRVLNTGMLFGLIWITVRFFDTDWNLIIKGSIFILLGLCILGVNIWMTRRIKK